MNDTFSVFLRLLLFKNNFVEHNILKKNIWAFREFRWSVLFAFGQVLSVILQHLDRKLFSSHYRFDFRVSKTTNMEILVSATRKRDSERMSYLHTRPAIPRWHQVQECRFEQELSISFSSVNWYRNTLDEPT
jgi:hypothetical protein